MEPLQNIRRRPFFRDADTDTEPNSLAGWEGVVPGAENFPWGSLRCPPLGAALLESLGSRLRPHAAVESRQSLTTGRFCGVIL